MWVAKVKRHPHQFASLIVGTPILTWLAVTIIDTDWIARHRDTVFVRYLVDWSWGCFVPTHGVGWLERYSRWSKAPTYIPCYTAAENEAYIRRCLVTRWHLIHFVVHLLAGMCCPDFAVEVLVCSTLFEAYEYASCRCEDVTDLVYNATGMALGLILGRIVRKSCAVGVPK